MMCRPVFNRSPGKHIISQVSGEVFLRKRHSTSFVFDSANPPLSPFIKGTLSDFFNPPLCFLLSALCFCWRIVVHLILAGITLVSLMTMMSSGRSSEVISRKVISLNNPPSTKSDLRFFIFNFEFWTTSKREWSLGSSGCWAIFSEGNI